MPAAFVGNRVTHSYGASLTFAVPGATPGNLLLYALSLNQTTTSCSDNTGNWTLIASEEYSGIVGLYVWGRIATGTSADNIDITYAAGDTWYGGSVNEYSGIASPLMLNSAVGTLAYTNPAPDSIGVNVTASDTDPTALFAILGIHSPSNWGALSIDSGFTIDHSYINPPNDPSVLMASLPGITDTTTRTPTYSGDGSGIATLRLFAFGLEETAAGGPSDPSITDVDGDETVLQGQTSVTITGTDFEASQGTGSVIISPTDNIADGAVVTQTVTSWGATSIDFTANFPGSVAESATAYLFVTNDTGDSNTSGFAITREAAPVVTTVTVTGITGGANLTALEWFVFDTDDFSTASVIGQGSGETTDSSGDLTVVLTNGPTNGQSVWYSIKNAAGTLAAQGPATVSVT